MPDTPSHPVASSQSRLGQPVFSCLGRAWTVLEVLAAAWLRDNTDPAPFQALTFLAAPTPPPPDPAAAAPIESLALQTVHQQSRALAWRLQAEPPAGFVASPEHEPAAITLSQSWALQLSTLDPSLIPPGFDTTTLRQLARQERVFEQITRPLLSHARRARTLLFHRIPLTRLQIDSLLVPDTDAAREACLCLRDDGATLPEVAALAGSIATSEERFLQDLPDDLQASCVSAVSGDVLPPQPLDSGFVVRQIVARIVPDLALPTVLREVDHRLLAGALVDSESDLLQWHPPYPRTP